MCTLHSVHVILLADLLEVSTGSRALSGRFYFCHVSLFEYCPADGAAEEWHAADVGILWPDRDSAHPQQPPARCRHLLVQVCLQNSLGQEVLLACLCANECRWYMPSQPWVGVSVFMGRMEQVALASCRCVGVCTVAPARCCTVHLYPRLYGIWHVKPVKGQRTVTQYEPRLRCRECNCGCCSECLAKSGLAIMNGAALRNEVPHALIGITSPMKFMERGCDCTPWVPRSSGENPSGLHKDYLQSHESVCEPARVSVSRSTKAFFGFDCTPWASTLSGQNCLVCTKRFISPNAREVLPASEQDCQTQGAG